MPTVVSGNDGNSVVSATCLQHKYEIFNMNQNQVHRSRSGVGDGIEMKQNQVYGINDGIEMQQNQVYGVGDGIEMQQNQVYGVGDGIEMIQKRNQVYRVGDVSSQSD